MKDCASCHEAHPPRDDPAVTCLECHRPPRPGQRRARAGGSLWAPDPHPDAGTMVDPTTLTHDAECGTCHTPHVFEADRLGCPECHEPERFKEERTRKLTGFRDGDRNLHFLHVNRAKKGRTCRTCHDVHASKQPFHITESVPFGTWELPVNFFATPTGGSCAPGCHKPKEYSRSKK